METPMEDLRTPKEVAAIRALCEAHKLDTEMADDPKVDLIEFGRRLKMILAVRQMMRPRIESTVGFY